MGGYGEVMRWLTSQQVKNNPERFRPLQAH